MEKKRLNQIKRRIKIRKRKNIIKLAIIIAGLVLFVILVTTAIKSVSKTIKESIPTPSPSPVAIISAHESSKDYAKIPEATVENDLLQFIESQKSQKKVCYLTFDDGPNNSVTPQILDILRRYNIKATFFQVGSLIEANPDMSRRVYEEGHLLANHSYDHTYSKIYANENSFKEEFEKCSMLIQDIVGDDYFPLIRFPGGSHNTGTYGEAKQAYKEVLAENNMYYCDWNALTGDAEGSAKTAKQLVEKIKSTSKGKNQVVVLMHDSSNKNQTVESLPEIIEYFINNGYVFSTLNKLLF